MNENKTKKNLVYFENGLFLICKSVYFLVKKTDFQNKPNFIEKLPAQGNGSGVRLIHAFMIDLIDQTTWKNLDPICEKTGSGSDTKKSRIHGRKNAGLDKIFLLDNVQILIVIQKCTDGFDSKIVYIFSLMFFFLLNDEPCI